MYEVNTSFQEQVRSESEQILPAALARKENSKDREVTSESEEKVVHCGFVAECVLKFTSE